MGLGAGRQWAGTPQMTATSPGGWHVAVALSGCVKTPIGEASGDYPREASWLRHCMYQRHSLDMGWLALEDKILPWSHHHIPAEHLPT